MNVSFQLGWWIVPLLITVIVFLWAQLRCAREPDHGFMPGGAMLALFLFPLAAVVSLASWLIWAIVH